MNVRLHIEHLVLSGIDIGPAESEHLRLVVSQQLADLLRRETPNCWNRCNADASTLAAPALRLGAAPSVSVLGVDLARSLHVALSQFGEQRSPVPR
jgi:hypothetical protein